MEIPLKQLKTLLKTLDEGGVHEFEYQDDKYRVRLVLARGAAHASHFVPVAQSAAPVTAAVASVAPPTSSEDGDPSVVFVTSPFVGTFYRSPAPDADPFCDVGSQVRKGQTLCIVEAMKLMNEIEAEHAGTILEVLADNGSSVEFGQNLFKIKKS
jgi:acetyl-CoA carboxylase biotin carboxyl carrier protein